MLIKTHPCAREEVGRGARRSTELRVGSLEMGTFIEGCEGPCEGQTDVVTMSVSTQNQVGA